MWMSMMSNWDARASTSDLMTLNVTFEYNAQVCEVPGSCTYITRYSRAHSMDIWMFQGSIHASASTRGLNSSCTCQH